MQRPAWGRDLPRLTEKPAAELRLRIYYATFSPSPQLMLLLPRVDSSPHAHTTVVQLYLMSQNTLHLWPPGPPSHYYFLADDTAGSRKDKQPEAAGK